jgi:hypothetical protein
MPNQRRSKRAPRRVVAIVSKRPVDPIITAQRFKVSNAHIPQYNVAPTVRRTVRIVQILTSGTPQKTFYSNDISLKDAENYTGGTSLRYQSLRLLHGKFWAESPNNLSVSQQPYGLGVSDPYTGFAITDRPTTGSRLNAIGLRLPFIVRTTFNPCNDTSVSLITIFCDTTIAAATDFVVTCDFTVEFSA